MSVCRRCGLETGGDGWHADAAECLEAALRRINNDFAALDLQEAANSCILSGRAKHDMPSPHVAGFVATTIGFVFGFAAAFVIRWVT